MGQASCLPEAVGQLAGGVAHDFNNLLQAILGYGELALGDDEGDHHTYIEEMLKAGHRAKTLVSQLLAYSRRQVLDMKDIDINDVVADMMKMIRRVIGEHITLDVIPGSRLGIVRADPEAVAEAVAEVGPMPQGHGVNILPYTRTDPAPPGLGAQTTTASAPAVAAPPRPWAQERATSSTRLCYD